MTIWDFIHQHMVYTFFLGIFLALILSDFYIGISNIIRAFKK